jgi:hypothetical protein
MSIIQAEIENYGLQCPSRKPTAERMLEFIEHGNHDSTCETRVERLKEMQDRLIGKRVKVSGSEVRGLCVYLSVHRYGERKLMPDKNGHKAYPHYKIFVGVARDSDNRVYDYGAGHLLAV